MVLMWLHVDSVSILTLKSQSSLTETNFRGGMNRFLAEVHLIGCQV